ncbi:ribonuclease HII [Ochrovirga pacifica]|uniref:ribonuclease HII n=1 Tax=Ochrovirga pacifica TaxID=1042376 RepID=UPI0002559D5F|nr:ribonuclease HII [Ochrovirga pacifica]
MPLLANFSGNNLEAGTDEAGRGCLAGPVVAAAVILPENFEHPLLNDSKKLTEKQRKLLLPIIQKEALAYSVAYVYQQEIDELNILQASITAMHRAIDQLTLQPNFIIVDGNKFRPYKDIPSETIVKGDGKYLSIAAASVLAKTYRDMYMEKLHLDFPAYNWKKNKGYPTKEHRKAILETGSCEHHRQSFKLLPEEQLRLF